MKFCSCILAVLFYAINSWGQLPAISNMEYYIDEDPGFGNGETIDITTGNQQDISINIPTIGLTSGFHILSVRGKDENNVWSHYESRPFFITKSTNESRENILAMEYFFDTDPGQSNGEIINISEGPDIELIEMIPISSLDNGFHTLSVRAMSTSGTWSMVEQRSFFISLSTSENRENILAMEYFFDSDPGQGNGETISISEGPDINLIEMIPTSSLDNGFHTLSVRAMSTSGTWSMVEQRSFFISLSTSENRENILAMEYFFDTDPGQSNGETISISEGPDIELIEMIPISSLDNGFHTLSVRAMSTSGTWSMVEQRSFFISLSTSENRENILAMEYFFDSDPGQGNGETISISEGPDINLIEMIPTSSLDNGFHTLSVRAMSTSGIWSHKENRMFYVAKATSGQLNTINKIEYYFDEDPGYGNGTHLSVSETDIDIIQNISTSTLTTGMHTITVRAQNENGVWGQIESRAFYKDPARSIVELDYAFDIDPGAGNGSLITIQPAQQNIDTNFKLPNPELPLGEHNIITRVKDGIKLWSEPQSKAFTVCEGPLADFSIGNITCAESPVQFTDLTTNTLNDDIYSWDFDGDGIADSNTNGDTNFEYSEPGTYTVTLTTDRNGCSSSKTKEVTIHTPPDVTAQSTLTDICFGERITLTGNGATSYAWDHEVQDGIPITPTENTTYMVTGTDENGCTDTSEIFISVHRVPTPTITLLEDGGVYIVTLVSSSESGNLWYQNGELIVGATDQTLEVLQSSNITLQVSDGKCNSDISEEFGVFVLKADQIVSEKEIYTWPNPAQDFLYIKTSPGLINNSTFEIYSVQGKLIKQFKEKPKSQIKLPVHQLEHGIYILLIKDVGHTRFAKFSKN